MSLHCRRTHECLDASAQGGGKDLHVLGSVPEPAGDFPPGAVMSGDRGGGGAGWGRRQSRCLADGAAASAAALAVYVNSARGEEDAKMMLHFLCLSALSFAVKSRPYHSPSPLLQSAPV